MSIYHEKYSPSSFLLLNYLALVSHSGIPAFSTPPPSFEEVLQNADGSQMISTTNVETESMPSACNRSLQANEMFIPAASELPEITW